MARPPLHLVTYPQIVPAAVSGIRRVTVKIPYAHLNYAHTIELDEALYAGAKQSSKSASVPAGIGDAWLEGYYRAFVFDKHLESFYPKLLAPFRKIRREVNLDSDRYLDRAIRTFAHIAEFWKEGKPLPNEIDLSKRY